MSNLEVIPFFSEEDGYTDISLYVQYNAKYNCFFMSTIGGSEKYCLMSEDTQRFIKDVEGRSNEDLTKNNFPYLKFFNEHLAIWK